MFNILRVLRRNRVSTPNTPDYQELEGAPGWLFFEYGEFKTGMPMHEKIQPGLRGLGFTTQKLPLWVANRGKKSFPIAVEYPHSGPRSSIAGELYLIPTNIIPTLDTYRQNGVNFDRKLVSVNLLNGDNIRAFMYRGNKDHWIPQIEWDQNFYREGSDFSYVEPERKSLSSRDFYSAFTHNHFREGCNPRCFLHVNDGTKPPEQSTA